MIKYSYDKEIGIVRLFVSDEINISEIVNYYLKLSEDNSLPKKLKTIIDCKSTKINADLPYIEIEKTRYAVEKAAMKFDSIYEAILVDSPHETAIATLFRITNNDINNYSFSIFHTEKAAMQWLHTL